MNKVREPYWETALLVGGGPSLIGFDFEVLRGIGHVLAVNQAVYYMPWADAVFSLDAKWIRLNLKKVSHTFDGEIFIAPPEGLELPEADMDRVTVLKRLRKDGLSDSPDEIHMGLTSGYGALNIAYLKRSKRIWLFGYDFGSRKHNGDTQTHWHNQYSWPNGEIARYGRYAKVFDSTVPQLNSSGIEVVNFSPGSRIGCFAKRSLSEIETCLVHYGLVRRTNV